MTQPRPDRYTAEGTCSIGTWRDPRAFREFLNAGHRTSLQGVREEFREPRLRLHVQGSVETYEMQQAVSNVKGWAWVKTVRQQAQRVHVRTVYVIEWP